MPDPAHTHMPDPAHTHMPVPAHTQMPDPAHTHMPDPAHTHMPDPALTHMPDPAHARLGGVDDNRCRVTVTDRFGGRGHDFQVVDKESNANGGMLVIATSLPDEREWIQWRGRTARQDRPGQFCVVLDLKSPPLSESKHKRIADLVRASRGAELQKRGSVIVSEDAKIEMMLEIADDGIGDRLKQFEKEQANGEKLNELTEKYYKAHPRPYTDPWPHPEHPEDVVLRELLTKHAESSVSEIRDDAVRRLKIELEH